MTHPERSSHAEEGAALLTEGVTGLGPCQIRSGTDLPCRRLAAIRILGVPFCEIHAREQKLYFLIGELTEAQGSADRSAEQVRDLRDVPLAEELGWGRRRSPGRIVEEIQRLRAVRR